VPNSGQDLDCELAVHQKAALHPFMDSSQQPLDTFSALIYFK